MDTCTCCEKEETEYTCSECGKPTCEDCFITMTQFNAGRELPCKACDGKRARADRAERDRDYAREEAVRAERDRRSAEARARYHSPKAVAARARVKVERQETRAKARREFDVELVDVMKGFSRFF